MFQSNLRHDHWLRSGGPDLKKTQVYPKAFGFVGSQCYFGQGGNLKTQDV